MWITFSHLESIEVCCRQINFNMKNIVITATLFLALLGCETKKSEINDEAALAEAKKAIMESNAIYFESFVKNDSILFIERYADDACIMAPNAPQLCGKKAAAEFFRIAYRDYGLRNGKFITTAIYGNGLEYVTEEGLWQSFDSNGNLFDDGKFLVLWKKTSSGWKMYRDSFSSNRNL